MKLSERLTPNRIRIPLTSETKDEVLRELVSILPNHDDEARERILQAIVEREAKMSTGIGQGVAIPHGKCELVTEMEIAFGISARPIDFASLDGKPVLIFFLLVSAPDKSGPHIRALAQISRMLSSPSLRDELGAARTPEDVVRLIHEREQVLFSDE